METEKIAQESALFEHHVILVDGKQVPLRVDKFLVNRLPNTTRTKLQLAIDQGFILINGLPVKCNHKVKPGDQIKVVLPNPPQITELIPEDIPLDIIYEDDWLLIVNKPAGMIVHPAHQHRSGTLVNALMHHLQTLPPRPGNLHSPGLVHRIDMHTSGLLVIAKQDLSMTALAKQFYDHSITRTYHALVWGVPKEKEGTIDIPLDKSPHDRRIIVASPDGETGKSAVTHYEVLQEFHYVSLLRCRLETGRTHQIRAHMKYLGHPLFGDSRYGGDQLLKGPKFTKYKQFINNCLRLMPRQALHATSLGFIHPHTQQAVHFESKLPEDFKQVLNKWTKYIPAPTLLRSPGH